MEDVLGAVKTKRLSGDELLVSDDGIPKTRLINFWRWAYSGITDNALRGVLAEFIVATAIGINENKVRNTWDTYDLETKNGTSIEVKSAAYLQSWKQKGLSKISFDCGKKQLDNTLEQDGKSLRRADLYIFALLNHIEKATWDPLDLSQWEFWVVPTIKLDEKIGDTKQIGLSSLQNMGYSAVKYSGLEKAIEKASEEQNALLKTAEGIE